MKISVITPSYNSGAVIEQAIRSVLEQDYADYEHIIVDGASTDGTVDILKKYPNLRWVSEPDRGQVDALNKGFAMSTGEVIVYLNADDYFCKGAFSAVIPYFEVGAKMVVGKVRVKTERPDGIEEWINDPKTDFASMLRHWEPNAFCVNPVGYFYGRELQEEIGGFNEENDARHDLEFLLELALRCDAVKIDRTLGVFNHAFETKTGLSQLKPGSWSIDSRPFIDRLAANLSPDQLQRFNLDRERGYQLRRYWTMKECFARGMGSELIDEGEVVVLSKEGLGSASRGGLTDFERVAARGDWVVVVLAAKKMGERVIYHELKKVPFRKLPAHVYYTAGPGLEKLASGRREALKWKIIAGVGGLAVPQSDEKNQADEATIKMASGLNEQLDSAAGMCRDFLGVDLYQYSFEPRKGYLIIREDNVEILLYLFEDLPRVYAKAMGEFLGISGLSLPSPKGALPEKRSLLKTMTDRTSAALYSVQRELRGRLLWRAGRKSSAHREETECPGRALSGRPGAEAGGPPTAIDGSPIGSFSFARKSHFSHLKSTYGPTFPQSTEELKYYQDLLTFAFICESVPPGSRLLEVGGGRSRILNYFRNRHECWNLDKFEGVGNGPKRKPDPSAGYRWVDGYAGDFSRELKDGYFDLVFSISVMEHIPRDRKVFQNIIDDCNRVLKPGGHAIHLVDIVLPGWRHPFIEYAFEAQRMLTELSSLSEIRQDPDLYVMPQKEYERTWQRITKKSYDEFGRPSSYNLIWRKEK